MGHVAKTIKKFTESALYIITMLMEFISDAYGAVCVCTKCTCTLVNHPVASLDKLYYK